MNKTYDNKELANAYFEVVKIPNLKETDRITYERGYRKIKELIANCPVNITFLYQEFKTLKELHIKGIGDGTKEILEQILEKGEEGIEEQKKKIQNRREERYRRILEMGRMDYREQQIMRDKVEREERERKREDDEETLDALINGCENEHD